MMILMLLLFFVFNASAQEFSLENLKQHVKYLSSKELSGRGPGTPGHQMANQYIRSRLDEIGLKTYHQLATHPFPGKPDIKNIVAKLSGTDKNARCVVLTAHYDHHNTSLEDQYFPGADDNAAGVAILLELARVFQSNPIKPYFDLYFAFPDYEELYLTGGPFLVSYIKSQCKKVLFNLNLDLVGAKFFPGMENIILALGGESAKVLNDLVKKSPITGLRPMVASGYIIEPFGIPRSDYWNFKQARIPYLFYTAGSPWFYHTPKDTFDKIDFPFVEKITRHLYQVIAEADKQKKGYRFITFPKVNYSTDAMKLSKILRRILDHKEENKLTPAEIESITEHYLNLKDGGSHIKKRNIHQAVIKLIRTVGSKDLSTERR